jgi:hypothetical protein
VPYRDPEKQRAYMRELHQTPAMREQRNAHRRARYRAHRDAAIEALGGRCTTCGSTEGLEVDHIDNDGQEDRKHRATRAIYRAIGEGATEGFQLLCRPHHVEKTLAWRHA